MCLVCLHVSLFKYYMLHILCCTCSVPESKTHKLCNIVQLVHGKFVNMKCHI